MEITVKIPQLDALLAELETVKTYLKDLLETNRVAAIATPALAQPEPAAEPERRGRRRKVVLVSTTSTVTGIAHGKSEVFEPAAPAATNGAAGEDQDDEDTLRARASFEAKRVQRTLGIGASRAVIKKIAGDGVLQIDDVPAGQLPQLLDELQAL